MELVRKASREGQGGTALLNLVPASGQAVLEESHNARRTAWINTY